MQQTENNNTTTTQMEQQQQLDNNTTQQAKKSSKKACAMDGCSDKPVKIIGDCRYCTSKFCSRHRLPEAHACPNLQNCKLDAANRLSSKLLQEKCVASKV